jgi:glycosyltransferase involved in cell wall biosynthesis
MRIMREMTSISRQAFIPLLACQPESQIAQEARGRGLELELVKIRGNIDPLAIVKFIGLYRRRSVHIVHTHSNADSWNASIAAKLSLRRPLVVRTRHLSASFNNRMIYNFMADRVVTTGEYVRQYMIRERNIDPGKVVAISSGIDLTRFDPGRVRGNLRGEWKIPPGVLVFGTASIFRKKKGHHHLLEATREILRSFPSAKLLLVGEGPQEKNLLRLIEELGIRDSVIMPGFQDDMPRVLNSMDVFVFPTLEEAFPNAVMEAMAMRKPVVASRVGGVPDIVQDGQTGYLVDPGDPRAIAEKVVALFKDKKLREEMGLRGGKFVAENASQQIMVQKLESLYITLMEERAA